MATGGIPMQRGQSSEPRLQGGPRSNRTRTAMDVNFRLNQWEWKPSSMFADGPFDKPKKSKNKEKPKSGQQLGLQSPSTSDNDARRHTPATFPRTRYTTSAKERAALESLQQQLNFSDTEELPDTSNDKLKATAINNARQQLSARLADAAQPEDSSHSLSAWHDSLKSGGESHVNNELQPDRNQIVGRLMQIRDYMRQATSMMSNLQRVTDGGRDENIDKLKRLQDHLRDQEKGYMDLLQRMLAEDSTVNGGRSSNNSAESFATSAAESMSLNMDGQSDISEATTGNPKVSEQMEELASLKQQHDLLKKMLQQQEELRALQSRQQTLLRYQAQVEGKLLKTQQDDDDAVSEATTTDATASELEETVISSAELARRRKEALKRIFGEESENASESEQSAAARITAQESQLLVMASEHEQLQSKLQDLQEKKDQMDELLVQLKALRPQALNNDGDSMSTNSMNILDVVSQATSVTEEARSETSQQAISDDKLRRLQEMRERLNQLRELVQYYQASQEEELAGAGDAATMPDQNPSSSSVNFEDPKLMSNLRLLQRGENIASHSGSGLNTNEEDDNEDEDEDDDDEDASESGTTEATENNETTGETTTEDETESNQSSIMARWGDDPEIREKVRKLQTAKAKLRQLQDLVAMVQHTPEFAGNLPDDLAELAMSIDEEASDQQSSTAAANEGLRAFTEETREAYFEAKMKQQKKELEKLMQERQRLLHVQNQLKDLNENPTPRKTLGAGKRTTAVQTGNALLEAAKLMEETKLATPTRDEIYAEMRRHKILQEELRQKRHELEELLSGTRSARVNGDELGRATYSIQSENDNDLFRVSMRSADITAAATWGSSTQDGSLQDEMENAEDADYPSDGVVQVEEEEEEVRSEARSSDTYTIEAQYRLRQRQPTSLDRPSSQQPRWILPHDSDSDVARHGIRYPTSPAYRGNARPGYRGLTQSERKRQENIRSAEDLMADDPATTAEDLDYLSWKAQNLERQLSSSVNMCHDLIRDQHNMSNLLHTSMSGNWSYPSQSPLPRNPYMSSPANPMNDMLANYNMRLQHQQLMLNLNQTYGQLYSLQEDIRNFEEMAQQQDGSINEGNYPNSNYPYGPQGPAMGSLGSMQSQYMQPRYPGMSYPPYGMNQYPPSYGLNASYTVPPYTSPAFNPYATANSAYDTVNGIGNQRARGARSRFNMNSVLNPQEHDEVPPNSELEDDQIGPSVSNREPSFSLDLHSHMRPTTSGLFAGATADDDLMATPLATASKRQVSSDVPPLNIDSLLKKMDSQRRRPGSDAVTSTSSKDASKQGGGLMAKAREMAKNPGRKRSSGPRPGLSSSLSGTAFLETASVTSTVSASSMPGELVNGEFFLPGERRRRRDNVKTQSELESDVGSEFSLFEALRETIYSEVATLISQNESRPHYLIELFRELQMLNSDYLRQRALYALQDLVSKFLTDEAIGAPLNAASSSHPVPPWQIPTASEHTPSESLITSEDDEMKARLYSQHPSMKDGSSVKSGEEYDYMEHVESASTMSTPNSTHDFGFANDDLGDTVIHLDKALRRMREYERMKAEQEATSSALSSNATAELHKKEGPQTSTDATSNSSAQDVGSESSFSSLPYPRIDTRQLDHQIKSIMQVVIPCLKEHIDDVCSSELLAYLRHFVLTLTRQHDDSQEFVRFFNKQLGSILQDSLSKFAGRKMRECGEDLLVDISEILFNELAFFRLMQDLDTTGNSLRMNAEEVSETGTDTGTGVDENGEEETSSEESSDEDTEAAEEEDEEEEGEDEEEDVTKAALETAMASASKIEEEDLGKARDDEMAADLGVSEKDDDSEEQSSKERVRIELSMSESKAVAYFGSGEEDDNDVDSASLKAEETITSIGASNDTEDEHQAKQNDLQVEVEASEVAETIDVAAVKIVVSEATEPEAEANATTEQEPEQSTDDTATNASLPNGDINQELTIEDLPPKLTSLSQVELEAKMSEEQKNNNSSQAVLESVPGMTTELAGDADAIPEPSSVPVANGMVHAGGDIGSE